MACYPVIMCGGAGVRLWPASNAACPKQFLPLTGERSLFQETVLRVSGVKDAQAPLIIAGAAHWPHVQAQLAAIGVEASVLLEPEPRDSAAAIAAACAWIEARDADGVALVVASDHHVPDAAAFAVAAETAVGAAAADFIVTMGVTPSGPNTAYCYIAPGEAAGGVRKVAAFVEKPNAAKATDYLAQGYLWNSGNFVARAALLLGELERLAPAVAYAARAGIAGAREADGATWLGDAFRAAPKKSIDYAVMEKTERAAVLPVSFAWSDLGAWDAVWAVSDRDANANAVRGAVTLHDVENALVRAAPGMRVVAIGVRDVAIVAEPGRVLVSGLDTAQSVKPIVEALRDTAEDGAPAPFDSLDAAKPWFGRWLRVNALPLWWSLGADHARGGFHEALTLDGRPCDWPRRMRVQARQVYAYAQAGMMGCLSLVASALQC
jgi:mannose-1-phosphate guanylyltransferase/mannose-6-phosphate isomerase